LCKSNKIERENDCPAGFSCEKEKKRQSVCKLAEPVATTPEATTTAMTPNATKEPGTTPASPVEEFNLEKALQEVLDAAGIEKAIADEIVQAVSQLNTTDELLAKVLKGDAPDMAKIFKNKELAGKLASINMSAAEFAKFETAASSWVQTGKKAHHCQERVEKGWRWRSCGSDYHHSADRGWCRSRSKARGHHPSR